MCSATRQIWWGLWDFFEFHQFPNILCRHQTLSVCLDYPVLSLEMAVEGLASCNSQHCTFILCMLVLNMVMLDHDPAGVSTREESMTLHPQPSAHTQVALEPSNMLNVIRIEIFRSIIFNSLFVQTMNQEWSSTLNPNSVSCTPWYVPWK